MMGAYAVLCLAWNVTAPLQVGVAVLYYYCCTRHSNSRTDWAICRHTWRNLPEIWNLHRLHHHAWYLFWLCMVWCQLQDELMSAVTSACNCNRDISCIVTVHKVPLTAVGVLDSAISTSLPRYYVGSSSTGPVGGSNIVCQDVSCK